MTTAQTYGFEITVDISGYSGDPEMIDALLFEAGLDDSLVSWIDGKLLVQVDRVVSSLGEAMGSAMIQIDSVDGLRVDRVQPVDTEEAEAAS